MEKREFTNVDLSIGVLGGIGAFTLARSVAKAFVKSKNPVVGLGLLVFEAAISCKAMGDAAGFANVLRTATKDGVNKVKKTLNEEVKEEEDEAEAVTD